MDERTRRVSHVERSREERTRKVGRAITWATLLGPGLSTAIVLCYRLPQEGESFAPFFLFLALALLMIPAHIAALCLTLVAMSDSRGTGWGLECLLLISYWAVLDLMILRSALDRSNDLAWVLIPSAPLFTRLLWRRFEALRFGDAAPLKD